MSAQKKKPCKTPTYISRLISSQNTHIIKSSHLQLYDHVYPHMYSPISRFSILLVFYWSIFMPITIFIVALQKSCCYQHTHPIVWVLSAVYFLISTVYLACHKFWMHFPFHSVQNTFEYSFRFLLWSTSNLEVCN